MDSGVHVSEAIAMHTNWMRGHGLEGSGEEDGPRFAVVTWGDSDVMTALESEIKRLGIPRPPHFESWVNLKALYKVCYSHLVQRNHQASKFRVFYLWMIR